MRNAPELFPGIRVSRIGGGLLFGHCRARQFGG
jgi:hypothetical protein